MAYMDTMISPVKRERLKRQEQKELKEKMRSDLPVLNREEIRRYRLAYHEAILYELQEQGFASAAEFLKQLIDYQENLRKEHGPDTAVWSRPKLVDTRPHLDLLYEGLRKAESDHYKGNVGGECDELIKLAVHFGLGSEDWWWLGEQLFLQCVSVTSDFHGDGGKRQATCRYIYGKFLLLNIKDAEEAKEHLKICRELSIGKAWNANKELDCKQETIFVESCALLYQALLIEAKEMLAVDPLKGARICAIARKRALDACNHKGEADALMLKGFCEMAAGDAGSAVISFLKALSIHTKANRIEEVCEARIHTALAYLKIGKYPETLEQLENLLSFAETNNLTYYIAQAHRFLGEYYLNQGKPTLATPLLIQALNIFHKLSDILNREQVRNLAAISAGQELMPKYAELILNCGKMLAGHRYVLQLANWKDSREIFWSSCDSPSVGKSSLASNEEEQEDPQFDWRESKISTSTLKSSQAISSSRSTDTGMSQRKDSTTEEMSTEDVSNFMEETVLNVSEADPSKSSIENNADVEMEELIS